MNMAGKGIDSGSLKRGCLAAWMGIVVCFVPLLFAVPTAKEELITINFPNGTLEQVMSLYAELTHRTAIRASNLQGRIILQGNGPLTKADAIIAMENVFSVNGFSVILQGEKFFKIVPSDKAKQEGVKVSLGDAMLVPADQLVSRVFQLKFIDTKEVQPSLEPMKHSYGQITQFPRTNTLLITDTTANLIEMGKLIDYLDRPLEAKVKTKFYQLHNAKAKDVVARIMELLSSSLGGSQSTKSSNIPAPPSLPPYGGVPPPALAGGGDLSFSEESLVVGKVTISADERTNQIILLTRVVNLPFFDEMIKRLDADTAAPIELKSMALKYAKADELAGLMNQILGKGGATTPVKRERLSGDTTTPPSTPPPTPSSPSTATGESKGKFGEGLTIYADPRTNSLIVMGTKEQIVWVQKFVNDVDILLAQVLLEGIVVEVTLSRTDTLGVEVLARSSEGQFAQAALVKSLTLNPIDASTLSSAAAMNGVTGLANGLNYFASLKNSKVDILIQALAQNSNVKILSQPVIQTSHNEEAKIVVAEKRPIVTSTAANLVGSQGTLQSNYEYKDIGIQLKIKPLVNPDGLVVLDILQIVDDLNGFQSINGNNVPIITHREASSVVSVQDGTMVILGGLIQNRQEISRVGIPLLSDIPILGYLFGSTTKTDKRTELMVLLKPTVLRSPEVASAEALKRRKALELFKKRDIPEIILNKKNLSQQIDAIAPEGPSRNAPAFKVSPNTR